MGAWLDRLAQRAEPALWLDDTAYSGRLLADGRIPWCDVTALIAWRLKAHALLKPSIAALDVGALTTAYAAASSGIASALAADRRPVGPLATLLSAGELQRHVSETLRGLRQSFRVPLALVVPSPRHWPVLAYFSAFNTRPPIGADDVDDASVLIAGFLRGFGDTGVDVLLLTDDEASAPATAGEIDWYESVINVARHYRWDLGLRVPAVPMGWRGPDFLIAPSGASGVDVGDAFWAADGPAPPVAPRGFRHATIPKNAAPERVLSRLAILRGP
jgi:hypothetical protein